MGWIKTDYRFQPHSAILYISQKHMLMSHRRTLEILESGEGVDCPSLLESAIQGMIDLYRPELSNCTVWFMNFNCNWCRWEIGVEHRSLPAVPFGQQIEPRPLDPAYERDMALSNGLESP